MCLGSISKDFPVNNMKKTRLHGYVYDFSINFGSIDIDDILDIHKCLTNKNNKKIMFGLNKKPILTVMLQK